MRPLLAADSAGDSLGILVLEADSIDTTAQTTRGQFPDAGRLQKSENLGYTGGNGAGISYTPEQGTDYMCILTGDVTVSFDSPLPLLGTLKSDPDAEITASVRREMESRIDVSARGFTVDPRPSVIGRLHAGEEAEGVEEFVTGEFEESISWRG